jgi:hypothetical protein
MRAVAFATLAAAVLSVATGVANASASETHQAARAPRPAPPANAVHGTNAAAPAPGAPVKAAGPKTFLTKVNGLHVRTQPNTARGSRVVTTLARAGTRVAVSCYLLGQSVNRDRVWYRTVTPAGDYVSGHYLRVAHEPAAGVARCTTARH